MEGKNKNVRNKTLHQIREGVKADFEVKNKCLVVTLLEELDHHNAIPVRERSDKIIEKQFVKDIVFDFTGTEFMDSSGIGVIMGRYKKVIFTGGRVAVTGVGSSVDRIFKLSGLYKIVHKFDTVEEAIKKFAP